ncbi:MAG TPA: DNA mismatch repair protein MutS, partial [Ktedonobacterales bacterium]|nr:DNA mismatch repair protein MutS [Ktedonobacterales bacterium]
MQRQKSRPSRDSSHQNGNDSQASQTNHANRSDHSPIRQQYLSVKQQHPDAIVFFRMGDFYEMFDGDAELAARELELTLTRRDWGRGERTAMAGVPHHAAQGYIARLVGKGYRVAVCEQVSDPALSKGLVEREVIRVVTPGAIVDPAMLAAKRNNYLAAAVLNRDAVGLAYTDITTGEFACTQFAAAQPEDALRQELARVQPAEVLIEATAPQRMTVGRNGSGASGSPLPMEEGADESDSLATRLASFMASGSPLPLGEDLGEGVVVTPFDARNFREDVARERLREQFGVVSLEAYGCERLPLAVRAAGAIIAYLREVQRDSLPQITALETYSASGFMTLDAHTRRNLELFESGRSGGVKGSLLWVLDATSTPMGGRLLRRWLAEPLLDLARL